MNLEGDNRLNLQLRLDFSSAPTGEARQAGREDIESPSAVSEPERPANTRRTMEDLCERANLKKALRQVRSNKGSAGVDGMTVDQLGDYLKQHWPVIREQLLEDKRLLKLIRVFLNAGVMENGLVSPSVEGTPQGGPLSPLLSNLVLDELDQELECRGHRFVRYADDCNIYVRSERAGHRVMESISRFITQKLKLKLKVNEAKSAVARPQERKFLGFSF